MKLKTILIYLISLLITLNLLLPANAIIVQGKNNCVEITIPKFVKTDNSYYRGAQPKDSDFTALSKLGIKTIIDLRQRSPKKADKQKTLAETYCMNYINIPLNPFIPPNEKQINCFFNILDNSANLPVFVHCGFGEDRTGVLTGLYRVKYYNWSFNKAFAEMKSCGYHNKLYIMQTRFLNNYTKSLNK